MFDVKIIETMEQLHELISSVKLVNFMFVYGITLGAEAQPGIEDYYVDGKLKQNGLAPLVYLTGTLEKQDTVKTRYPISLGVRDDSIFSSIFSLVGAIMAKEARCCLRFKEGGFLVAEYIDSKNPVKIKKHLVEETP